MQERRAPESTKARMEDVRTEMSTWGLVSQLGLVSSAMGQIGSAAAVGETWLKNGGEEWRCRIAVEGSEPRSERNLVQLGRVELLAWAFGSVG